MADNIVLPAVPVLKEIDDSTKLLIEQAGEINRYPISDLDIGGGDVTIDLNSPGGDSTNTGNPINADTLGGYPAEDYAKLSDLEHLDTSGVSMELRWENASPASDMNAQDITLDTDEKLYLLEYYAFGTTYSDFKLVKKGKTNRINFYGNASSSGLPSDLIVRDITITGGKLSLSDATNKEIGATSVTTVNHYLRPFRVFAVKGVST